jgi:two-component system cell cycle sensor histidine kinase/response regulator CckA
VYHPRVSPPHRFTGAPFPPGRVAEWFIPHSVRERGREAVVRSQAILGFVAVGLLVGCASAILDIRGGAAAVGLSTLCFSMAGLVIPFVLRRTGSLLLAGNLLVGILFLMLFVPGLLTLGRGPGVVFLFLVPAFAVLFCGRRAAIAWSIAAAAGAAMLGALSGSALVAPVELPLAGAVPRLHRIAFFAIAVSAASMLIYDGMKSTALRELERANLALRESREQYRQLVETSPDGVFVSREGRILYANSRAVELLGGHSEADVVGRSSADLIDSPRDVVERWRGSIYRGGRIHDLQFGLRTLVGETVPVTASASAAIFEGEPAILSIVRDRRAEEATLARLRLLGTVIDQAHEGVLVVDSRGQVRYVNDAYARARGWAVEEMIGRRVADLPRNEAGRSFLRGLKDSLASSGGVAGGRFSFDLPEGRWSWDIRVFPVQTGDPTGPLSVTLLRDVSREVELEELARQSQKMEAVGQLAGGIAHDFNNHLTVILGHAEELRAALPAGEAVREVDAIVEAADRSAALTQQLLAFARRQAVDVGLLDVNEIVRGMQEMLQRLLPERIELAIDLDSRAPAVLADRGQLEQVVLNLVLNARDAIAGSGRISVTTASGSPAGKLADGPGGDLDEPCAILRVHDDGKGMDDAVRRRMFEPFFTTKPPGQGTGLGLSTVHGIVHQSGGALAVRSAPGEGTEVEVYLPGSRDDVETARPEPALAPRPAATTGTVLVVEDEASVRRLTRRALEAAGFRVLEAEDGAIALRIAEGAELDLVVTDIVMPGMSGVELAERIAPSHPGLPVLFVSGYADEAPESRGGGAPGRELLGKPFRPRQLVERVRRLIEARRRGV